MSDKPQINFNGGNFAGVQVGDNNTQTTSQTVESSDSKQFASHFFCQIAACVPVELVADVVEPLEVLADLPEEQRDSPTVTERAKALFDRLAPYAPSIARAVGVFGGAALTSLASSNPIIAGICALCNHIGEQQK